MNPNFFENYHVVQFYCEKACKQCNCKYFNKVNDFLNYNTDMHYLSELELTSLTLQVAQWEKPNHTIQN